MLSYGTYALRKANFQTIRFAFTYLNPSTCIQANISRDPAMSIALYMHKVSHVNLAVPRYSVFDTDVGSKKRGKTMV